MGLLTLAGGREGDGGNEVDQFAKALLVEAGAGVVLGQNALEAGVVALDGDHGVIHDLADGGLLGAVLQVAPAGGGGHPEDILGLVLVLVLGVGTFVVALAGHELGAVFLEGVGDVLEEDETEDNVLVLRRVHVVAELVGSEPELGLEPEVGGGVGVLCHGIPIAGHCKWPGPAVAMSVRRWRCRSTPGTVTRRPKFGHSVPQTGQAVSNVVNAIETPGTQGFRCGAILATDSRDNPSGLFVKVLRR